MPLDMMQIFNNEYPGSPEDLKQSHFLFDTSPDVYLIDESGKIVDRYEDLPQVTLTTEEQKIYNALPEPKLNEPQILIKKVKYENGKVFLQAYRCDYKLLSALGSRRFPADSPVNQQLFFKTGAIAALMTSDNRTVIVERNDAMKLFSSFSGFMKTDFKSDENVVIATALEETHEEFSQYLDGGDSVLRKPSISCVSLRKGNITGKFGTAEFVVTIGVNYSSQELRTALDKHLTDAKKPDGKPDHTGRYLIIDPTNLSEESFIITSESGERRNVRSNSFFLVDPIITSACKRLALDPPPFMYRPTITEIEQQSYNKSWADYIRKRQELEDPSLTR